MYEIEKILPTKYPFITSYPEKANILSVLLNHREPLPWILSQYIQLELIKSYSFPRLDFYSLNTWKTCPWIYYQRISRSFINFKWNSFTEFIIDCISQDLYVYAFLCMDCFGYQFNHDKFIYGYNKEEQVFYVADFFLHTASAYAHEKISFADVEKAYLSTSEVSDWLSGIELISYRKTKNNLYRISKVNYSLDIKGIRTSLHEYLYSINSSDIKRNSNEQSKNNFVFGLDIYKQLEEYMDYASTIKDMDTRPFHVLYDHKKYMLFLVYYLTNNYPLENSEIIYNNYYNLTQCAFKLRNLVIRYNAKPTEEVLNMMYNILDDLCKKERETLCLLIESIDKLVHLNKNNDISKSTPINIKTDSGLTDINIFNKRIYYSEGWYSNLETLGKIISSTNTPDEFLLVDFSGTSISYFAPKNNNCGYVDIYLDGIKQDRIDLYSRTSKETELIYHKENISPGYHIFKIMCTGEKNPDSQDCVISFERLSIQSHETEIKGENIASLIEIDTQTKGSWMSTYGGDGYEIFGSYKSLPHYTNYDLGSSTNYVWSTTSDDVRALQNPDLSENRIASCQSNDNFTIDLIIAGNEIKNVAFYLCNFDRLRRMLQVTVIDYDSKQVLCTTDVDEYTEGIYLQYKIKGRVLVTFVGKQSNAILSGIFFG